MVMLPNGIENRIKTTLSVHPLRGVTDFEFLVRIFFFKCFFSSSILHPIQPFKTGLHMHIINALKMNSLKLE